MGEQVWAGRGEACSLASPTHLTAAQEHVPEAHRVKGGGGGVRAPRARGLHGVAEPSAAGGQDHLPRPALGRVRGFHHGRGVGRPGEAVRARQGHRY